MARRGWKLDTRSQKKIDWLEEDGSCIVCGAATHKMADDRTHGVIVEYYSCCRCDAAWSLTYELTSAEVGEKSERVMLPVPVELFDKLLALAEAVEECHVIPVKPSSEEVISAGIAAANALRREVSGH